MSEKDKSITLALGYRTQQQRLVNAHINGYQEAKKKEESAKAVLAKAQQDCEAAAKDRRRARDLMVESLDDLIEAKGAPHPYPGWLIPTLKANVLSVQGGTDLEQTDAIEKSLAHEKAARDYALGKLENAATEADKQAIRRLVARSENNISDDLRSLGRFREAVPHAVEALQIWPENVGFGMNLVISLARADHFEDAEQLLQRLISDCDLGDREDVVRAYALYDDEFRNSLAGFDPAQELICQVMELESKSSSN